jgi:UDP-N-acetylenolpyruvoylglucosamine reductase
MWNYASPKHWLRNRNKRHFCFLRGNGNRKSDMKTFTKDECHFGYRESVFKNEAKKSIHYHIGCFKLTKIIKSTLLMEIFRRTSENNISNPTLKDVSNAVISIRQSKLPDPKELGNSGSFLKSNFIKIRFRKNTPAIS